MSASIIDLVIEQGATFAQAFTWSIDGVPVNAVDMVARMQVRAQPGNPPLLELSSENGRIDLGADGTVALFLDSTTTAGLDFTGALYDLEVTEDPEATPPIVWRVMQGHISVSKEITR